MKPAPFGYARPARLDDALALLRDAPGEVRLLAGGQSLVPMLHMRLVRPDLVVDLNRVPGLDAVEERDGHLAIGPLARYSALESDPLVAREAPLLAAAIRCVGDRQVRNRGTLGGSLAQADPVGEMPLACLALDAILVLRSADEGAREVAIDDFLLGAYTTDLEPEEVLVEIRVPRATRRGLVFEVTRRHNDFAVIAIAIAGVPRDGAWHDLRIAVAGADDRAILAREAMEALEGGDLGDDAIQRAGATGGDLGDPASDVRASEEYRRHLIAVHLGRALRRFRDGEGTVGV